GPSPATGVTITHQIAAGLTPGNVTATRGSCTTSASGLVSCSVGDLPAGASMTVTIGVTAAATGTLQSTASVSGSGTDSAPANNTAMQSVTVTAPRSGGGGGGGAASLLELLLAGLAFGVRRSSRSSAPGVPTRPS